MEANPIQANLPKPGETPSSPKGKHLYRYLGQGTRIQIDFFHQPVELNDLVLLCTNGLWHMLTDAHIKEILAQGGDPQKLARILVDDANLAGGDGNLSAIVVGIQYQNSMHRALHWKRSVLCISLSIFRSRTQ
jgi:serine/threonine protein phosphatase PrpC